MGVLDQEDRAPYQVPVRHESEMMGPLVVAHASREKSIKRGRPIDSNINQDDQWFKRYKKSGMGVIQFAEMINKPVRSVRLALDRARKRNARRAQ